MHGEANNRRGDRLGRSPSRVAVVSFGLAAIYGVIHRTFPQIVNYKGSAHTWITPAYFSIVTYTTLGFGDIKPRGLAGKLVVSSEVILGCTTLALLLFGTCTEHCPAELTDKTRLVARVAVVAVT